MKKMLKLVKFETSPSVIRTTAEGAKRKSVVPRSRTFGRVGTQLEAVVGVGFESFDEG